MMSLRVVFVEDWPLTSVKGTYEAAVCVPPSTQYAMLRDRSMHRVFDSAVYFSLLPTVAA